MPYFAGSILVAYMASVEIYKIWYIVTAIVSVFAAFVLILPRLSDVGRYLADAKWFILYWVAVAASVVTSIDPERSQYALLTDSIYPCVFMVFYVVALRYGDAKIEQMMRLQVYAAAIVLFFTLDVRIEDRIGYRIAFILPYVVPFVAIAICRGSRLAIAEIALLALLILLTNSRAQIGVAVFLSALSLYAFSRSLGHFLERCGACAVACSTMIIAACLASSEFSTILLSSVARAVDTPIAGAAAMIDDHARQHLFQLFWQMAADSGLTGIGYFAFGPIYVSHGYDSYTEMSLHSIYEVWWLEMGYFGTAAALLMLISFFRRTYAAQSNVTVAACTLGTIGALIAGGFHQMHQTPMLYVMLGMGLGAARRLQRSGGSMVIDNCKSLETRQSYQPVRS